MKYLVKRLLHLINTLYRIRQVNMRGDLKRAISATWLRAFFLRSYDKQNKTFHLSSYRIHFIDHHITSFLFDELFLNHDYYFLPDNDTPLIIDCGSNIGMSIIYFKFLYPNSRVIGFEPGQETFQVLQSNISDNHLTSVEVINAAVTNYEGEIDFFYDDSNVGSLRMSTKRERMPKLSRKIRAVRLSNYINSEVDFLKLDVEGAELDVIGDLINSGKLSYIKQMIIEYHHHLIPGTDEFSRLLSHLENAGFGYQIGGYMSRPLMRDISQDILVYAYRKPISG